MQGVEAISKQFSSGVKALIAAYPFISFELHKFKQVPSTCLAFHNNHQIIIIFFFKRATGTTKIIVAIFLIG